MRMLMKRLFPVIAAFFIGGCSHTISYRLSDISPMNVSELKGLSISIQTFKDLRRTNSKYKSEIFESGNTRSDDCYNEESGYNEKNTGSSLCDILAEHLSMTRVFKKVYRNNNDSSDLSMAGELPSFEAYTMLNHSAIVAQSIGAQFGLVGGLVSAAVAENMRSDFDYVIKYQNIVVTDKHGNIICNIGEYRSAESMQVPAVASCSVIYNLLNGKLKAHNDEFIKALIDATLRGSRQNRQHKSIYEQSQL